MPDHPHQTVSEPKLRTTFSSAGTSLQETIYRRNGGKILSVFENSGIPSPLYFFLDLSNHAERQAMRFVHDHNTHKHVRQTKALVREWKQYRAQTLSITGIQYFTPWGTEISRTEIKASTFCYAYIGAFNQMDEALLLKISPHEKNRLAITDDGTQAQVLSMHVRAGFHNLDAIIRMPSIPFLGRAKVAVMERDAFLKVYEPR